MSVSASGWYERHDQKSWFLDGIFQTKFNEDNECKFGFTSISDFFEWIKEIVEVEISTTEMKIYCDFNLEPRYGYYICKVEELKTGNIESMISAATGNHHELYTNNKVAKLLLSDLKGIYFPNGIGFVFENLKILHARTDEIKFLKRRNFKGLKTLIEFQISGAPIEDISDDVFDDLEFLKLLLINETKIKKINLTLLQNLRKLESLYLSFNEISYINTSVFRNNLQLKRISLDNNEIIRIDGKFGFLDQLSALFLRGNKCIDLDSENVAIDEMDKQIEENCSKD